MIRRKDRSSAGKQASKQSLLVLGTATETNPNGSNAVQ